MDKPFQIREDTDEIYGGLRKHSFIEVQSARAMALPRFPSNKSTQKGCATA